MQDGYAEPAKPGKRFDRPLGEVAAAEAQRCAGDPNIACVGFGLKFVGGKPMLRAALQYHVLQKHGSDEAIRASGSTPVAATVEGYDTDVLQWAADRATACPGSKPPTGERGGRKQDPLVGGTSTTVLGDFHSFPTGYGTLGGICFDAASGDAMALSNAHVYGFDTGNDAIQPWLPGSEYLEASVKYLTCGGPLAHLFFWTAPSPLTSILTTAAAAAWTAAALSDAEDPSRWGQRTGAVPESGVMTEREVIHMRAEVPDMPFPGRSWTAKTEWEYARVTTSGTTTAAIGEKRVNEHVLVGKRVITDRDAYLPGDRVTICAQLLTPARSTPIERFVVANCFPVAEPGRIVRRVLVTDHTTCAKVDRGYEKTHPPVCVHGFAAQVPGLVQMSFPILAVPFVVLSGAGTTRLYRTAEADNPSGVDALQIPEAEPLKIVCPPSTHVELQVFHLGEPVEAFAISANGTVAAQAATTGDARVLHKLTLAGPEIVRVEIRGGGDAGFLSSICADKRPIRLNPDRVASRYYTGSIDLSPAERRGTWAVVVVSQTPDDTETGGDPIRAARRLGGIVDSANVVASRECACSVLFDHTFDVVPGIIT